MLSTTDFEKLLFLYTTGGGRCKDNIRVERLWHTIKKEYIYLNPADDGQQFRLGLSKFMKCTHNSVEYKFYNNLI
jgi:putative transposase